MVSRLIPLIATFLAAVGCSACASTAGAPAPPPNATGPLGKSRVRLWAVGDSAGGTHAPEVARLIKRGKPDRVLYLGDIYDGNAGFADYKRLYGSLPVARTPGNDDWPHFWSGPEWYSFTAAGWRVIELNSETSRGSQQLAWLRTQLRARGTCRIAFWHRPRYSAGPHGDATDMDPYWRALQGRARIVLSGHDHDLERYAPRGTLIQLVSGAGGESHYPLIRSRAGLRFGDSAHWGALRLDLAPHLAKLAFVAAGGTVLDSSNVRC